MTLPKRDLCPAVDDNDDGLPVDESSIVLGGGNFVEVSQGQLHGGCAEGALEVKKCIST